MKPTHFSAYELSRMTPEQARKQGISGAAKRAMTCKLPVTPGAGLAMKKPTRKS